METGLRGLLALGSNGEAAFVDEDEAERIVATVREGVPRDRVLLVGTGRQSTRATIAATKRAATGRRRRRAGADAVLLQGQMTHDALVAHYRAVADASPVPVLLYNFTNVTGINMAPDTVAALSAHPNIVGIKDSNGDIGQVAAIVARVPADFTVLVGIRGDAVSGDGGGRGRRHRRRGQRGARRLREALRPRARRQARRGASAAAEADAARGRGDGRLRHRRA